MAEYLNNVLKDAKVLIVDDNKDTLYLMNELLGEDIGTLHLEDDPLVINARHWQENYDLIVLDYNMPVRTGVEALIEFRKEFEWMPIIMCTANGEINLKYQCLNIGAKDFIEKPFSRMELFIKFSNIVEMSCLYKDKCNRAVTLESELIQKNNDLYNSRLSLIRSLGKAAEFRDNETGMHIMRMSHYSELLAKLIGMKSEDCELLLNASPMHDVGKIGISDRILLKPAKLDDVEFEIMKTHTTIGGDILEGYVDSELIRMARIIALEHHEKFDGTGYPFGKKGSAISIFARIVAIADVFDALTSKRPYKQAWTVEEATNYIKEQSGRHFDPMLVDIFIKHLPEFIQIKDQYND